MKTAELTGAQLDYWVAKADGVSVYADALEGAMWHGNSEYRPSTNWALGGPIIERERISVWADGGGTEPAWCAETPSTVTSGQLGPTPLIAAMRAYVASKFGEEVRDGY